MFSPRLDMFSPHLDNVLHMFRQFKLFDWFKSDRFVQFTYWNQLVCFRIIDLIDFVNQFPDLVSSLWIRGDQVWRRVQQDSYFKTKRNSNKCFYWILLQEEGWSYPILHGFCMYIHNLLSYLSSKKNYPLQRGHHPQPRFSWAQYK